MSSQGGLLVGSIYAKLGAIFDPKGFREQELAAKKVKEQADKPIIARGGMAYEGGGFKSFLGGITSSRSATKDFDHDTISLRQHIGGLSFGIGGLAQNLIGGAGAFGLYEALKTGAERMAVMEKASAQTTAVIKTTGGAAKITAKEVDELSMSLFRKTGVDHEQILAGENIILTYTNVRNEVGKNRDIYNQAVKAALNFSVATGQNMTESAKSLGDALNNPAVGLTRLSRAGIQFSAQQKEQIKTLQEEGNLWGAQRMILEAVEKRYGGVAEKIGKTVPAAFNRAKISAEDLLGALAEKAAPTVTSLANGFTNLAKGIETNTGVGRTLRDLWDTLVSGGKGVVEVVEKMVALFQENSEKGEIFRAVLIGLGVAFVGLKVIKDVSGFLQIFLNLLEDNPIGVAVVALVALGVLLDSSGVKFKSLGEFMTLLWRKVKDQINEVRDAVERFAEKNKGSLENISRSVSEIAGAFGMAVTAVGKFILTSGALGTIGGLLVKLTSLALGVVAAFVKLASSKEGIVILSALIGAMTGKLVALIAAFVVEKIVAFIGAVREATGVIKAFILGLADNPLTAFLVVIGLVAGALFGLSVSTKQSTETNREYNESLSKQRELLRELQDLDLTRAEKLANYKSAVISVKEAEEQLNTAREHGIKGTPLLRAESSVEQAKTGLTRAKEELDRSPGETAEEGQKKLTQLDEEKKKQTDLIATIKSRISSEKEQLAAQEHTASRFAPGEQARIAIEQESKKTKEGIQKQEERLGEVRSKNTKLDREAAPVLQEISNATKHQTGELQHEHDAREKHIHIVEGEITQLKLLISNGDTSAGTASKLHDKVKELTAAQKENAKADQAAQSGLKGFGESAESAAAAASGAASITEQTLNAALKAMGVKPISFTTGKSSLVSGVSGGHGFGGEGSALGGGLSEHAGGGWLGHRGQTGKDDKLVLAADGEGFVNSNQIPHVEDAMAIAHAATGGDYPFRNLDDLFDQVKTPHGYAAGGLIRGLRRFAGGGINREQAMEREADRINALRLTYQLGGGHGSTPAPADGPFDCSSAVSRVLQVGGYKIATDTTPALLTDWHFPGGPGPTTIYAKGEPEAHTFMKIGSRYWGTSGFGHPGFSGPGWFVNAPASNYLSEFSEIHPPGLGEGAGAVAGAASIKKVTVKGPAGGLRTLAQAAANKMTSAAQAYYSKQNPPSTGGGNAAAGGGGKKSAGGTYNKKQLEGIWRQYGGKPSASGLAAAIALAESAGNPNAENHNTNGSIDRGLWQINSVHGAQSTFNIEGNTKAAISISSNGSDWSAWDTFKNGAYRQFMNVGGLVRELAGSLRRFATGGKTKTSVPKPAHNPAKGKGEKKRKVSNRKEHHTKTTKPPKLPGILDPTDKDNRDLADLANLDEQISAGDLDYNQHVYDYNKENTLAGNTIPEKVFDEQQQTLIHDKNLITSLLKKERDDVNTIHSDFEREAGDHGVTKRKYDSAIHAAKKEETLLNKLTAQLTKLTKTTKQSEASAQRNSLSRKIATLKSENGKLKGGTPAKPAKPKRYDPQGNLIPEVKGTAAKPGKPVDKTKEIKAAEEALAKFDKKNANKGAEEALKERIKAVKDKLAKDKKAEKEEKQKLDAWKKLAEGIKAKSESLPAEIESTEHEAGELSTTEATTNKGDEETAEQDLDTLTPEQQKEQDQIEYEISQADASSTNTEAQAAAELPVEERFLKFAQGVLAFRQNEIGPNPTADGFTALKDAQDQVNSISQQIQSLTGSVPGGAESADATAKEAQQTLIRENLEKLNTQAQGEIAAFASPGDIGSGYSSAYSAAAKPGQYGSPSAAGSSPGAPAGSTPSSGPTLATSPSASTAPKVIVQQTIQTLHPSDPATLSAIAGSTVNAFNNQNFTRSSRESVL
jgi:hypothetical protein